PCPDLNLIHHTSNRSVGYAREIQNLVETIPPYVFRRQSPLYGC
ncbi:hypothetical protein HMPREF3156_00063, partial [Neisseria sp. HMSC06F02]